MLLSPYQSPVESIIADGDEVVRLSDRVSLDIAQQLRPDRIVSYGYRYMIDPTALSIVPRDGAVNLHVSYLPYNRGADPNFWSWFDDTPKGVTIHVLDEGLDTGAIVAQREVSFTSDETLSSSYDRLRHEIESLFRDVWPSVRDGLAKPAPQATLLPARRAIDKQPFFSTLPLGWHTPVSEVQQLGERWRAKTR